MPKKILRTPSRRKKLKTIVASEIVLKDAEGKTRLYLTASDAVNGTVMALFGKNGASIEARVNEDGTSTMAFHRPYGQTLLVVYASEEAQAITWASTDGKRRVITTSTSQTNNAKRTRPSRSS